MIYLQKGQVNVLSMNINNNARPDFSSYTFNFTHVMSQESKEYVIPTELPDYSANTRYCKVILDLETDDLNYEGQYVLKVYGNGVDLIYNSMVVLEGMVEEPALT